MNGSDTQTDELLQKGRDEKLAPPKAGEFALILLRKGRDQQRLVEAIAQINKWDTSDAAILAGRETPMVINFGLTEEEALSGQFELICCDAISIFLRSEVVQQNDESYLLPLFKKILQSSEFKPAIVRIEEVPKTELGDNFVERFLGAVPAKPLPPVRLIVTVKKARIMQMWASLAGARLWLAIPDTERKTWPWPPPTTP